MAGKLGKEEGEEGEEGVFVDGRILGCSGGEEGWGWV